MNWASFTGMMNEHFARHQRCSLGSRNPRLNSKVLGLLRDPDETIFVSAVTSCEIAIKWSQGKIELATEPETFLTAIVKTAGYSQLPITIEQAAVLATLPYHHRDPWNRMLIAQAMTMGYQIITSDRTFKKYDVEVILA